MASSWYRVVINYVYLGILKLQSALCRLLLLLCLTIMTIPAQANENPVNKFLSAVQTAARTLDYDGIYVYQHGGFIQSTRVVHLVDGTGEHERLEILDGKPRECLRHNGVEQCLLPEHKHIVSRPARSDHFPGVLLAQVPSTYEYYKWRQLPYTYRVAGRECSISELKSLDALRYSYRFCTDTENNLLLKMQTINAAGELIDQVAFARIKTGTDVAPEKLKSQWNTRDWSLWSETSKKVDLHALGWRFSLPAGFVPIAEMSRSLGPDHNVMQLVLSDGLAAVSVFIETFNPDIVQKLRQGSLREGAVNVYRLRLASYWLTVVGEVPRKTIKDLAQAIQYVPDTAQ